MSSMYKCVSVYFQSMSKYCFYSVKKIEKNDVQFTDIVPKFCNALYKMVLAILAQLAYSKLMTQQFPLIENFAEKRGDLPFNGNKPPAKPAWGRGAISLTRLWWGENEGRKDERRETMNKILRL